MATFDSRQTVIGVFSRLRRNGIALGIGELLAALKAIDEGWGVESPQAFKQILQLLWCSSLEEISELEIIWETISFTPLNDLPPPSDEPQELPQTPHLLPDPVDGTGYDLPPPEEQPGPPQAKQSFGTLPVQTPFIPTLLEEVPVGFDTYWPLSRRDMIYVWRYLRRTTADGPADVLDVPATVTQTAWQGFYLSPVYRRREINHAHLVLFIDQGGSMMPFHRFSRDIVDTAQNESNLERTDVFYFHNVPTDNVYTDPHMTTPVLLDHALAPFTNDTSIIIVSDGGAARGYRHRERIRATTRFLAYLKRYTISLAWLNPLPTYRWPGSSAQIIAHLVPMFQMNPDGFSSAIDIVRGQPLYTAPR